VAVYYVVDPAGRRQGCRHIDLDCAGGGRRPPYAGLLATGRRSRRPTWQLNPQLQIVYTTNRRDRPACELCLKPDLGPLPLACQSAILNEAANAAPTAPGVYEFYDDVRRLSQVGSGSLRARVRARVKAITAGRYGSQGVDGVWWAHDLLRAGREPHLRFLAVEPGQTPLAAEAVWRELRRRDGWQVTSVR